ncbi:MAG: mechanosensitive ion channel domain-containing protein [Candidatus Korobacteraceae bacterium]
MTKTTKARVSAILDWPRGIMKIKGAAGRKPWLRLISALLIIAAGAIALAQSAPASLDSSQIIQFLNQTIDWYRHATRLQQIATEPDDFMLMADDERLANQIVRLGFDFARAESDYIAKRNNLGTSQNQSGSSSSLVQWEAKLDKQTQKDEAEAESLRQKLETTTGKKRQQLESQLAEIEAELDLAKARSDQVHSLLEFMNQASGSATGATGLQAQIQLLAESVPAASAPSNGGDASLSAKQQLSPALIAAANKPPPSGIWDLSADLFALSQKIRTVDGVIAQTKTLIAKSRDIRSPLASGLRDLSSQGDELGRQADSANQSQLGQEKQQLDALAAQFKQLSAPVISLAKQEILLDLYQKNLGNWESNLRSRRLAELKGLVVRLALLAFLIGIVITAAELWRRGVYRYVHERRRRYQLLLLRKFVLWFVIVVIVAFSFANRLGSVVTFAGLITAGLAVALQNVILSVVGYFFLIGKFGIRVGDRVQIGDVTGEVIDIGLVRMHLMELSKGDYTPTGRVVAFSNSIVFQPTSGLFKQIPGTNFLWHEITLALSPDTDYSSVKERLLKVVEAVLADYRDDLEQQYRAMQSTLFSTSADGLRPKAQLRHTPSAVEVVIRYPVAGQQAAEIDERVTRELMKNLDREPKLKLASSGGSSVQVGTDLAAA